MIVIEDLHREVYKMLSDFNVYDEVPKNHTYPYLKISVMDIKPHETKHSWGQEIDLRIHVWSNYKGKKEVYNIIDDVCTILSDPITLENENYYITHKKIVRCQVLDDVDGILKHGIVQIKFFIKRRYINGTW